MYILKESALHVLTSDQPMASSHQALCDLFAVRNRFHLCINQSRMILAFVTSFSRSVCLMMKIRTAAAAAIEQVERRRALSIIHVSNPPAGLFLRSVVNEMREAHARSLALLEKCTHQKFQQPAMWDYLTSIPRTTVAVRLIIHLHATHSIHNTEPSAHNKCMVGKSRRGHATFFCVSRRGI
jgi:hypothetical protein